MGTEQHKCSDDFSTSLLHQMHCQRIRNLRHDRLQSQRNVHISTVRTTTQDSYPTKERQRIRSGSCGWLATPRRRQRNNAAAISLLTAPRDSNPRRHAYGQARCRSGHPLVRTTQSTYRVEKTSTHVREMLLRYRH